MFQTVGFVLNGQDRFPKLIFCVQPKLIRHTTGKLLKEKALQIGSLRTNSHFSDNTAEYMWEGWGSNKQNSLMAFLSWQGLCSSKSFFLISQLDSYSCLITRWTERMGCLRVWEVRSLSLFPRRDSAQPLEQKHSTKINMEADVATNLKSKTSKTVSLLSYTCSTKKVWKVTEEINMR